MVCTIICGAVKLPLFLIRQTWYLHLENASKKGGLEKVKVLSVVDGDTLKIKRRGKVENIRLTGMDAYESSENARSYYQMKKTGHSLEYVTQMGILGTLAMEDLMKNNGTNWVWLEYDAQRCENVKDRQPRTLAYVWAWNKEHMLNLDMVRSGYAEPCYVPPNRRYKKHFDIAGNLAKKEKRGLFGDLKDVFAEKFEYVDPNGNPLKKEIPERAVSAKKDSIPSREKTEKVLDNDGPEMLR